ncbi:metal ABC transporter permease [Curvibacter sp. CHRR-16]|uniref:metal ABC transporter permease n=1 Tax=Curvibacter sp. CHRR-16 TaxID=2835872 RepID=UPI001BDA838B|nr:metal ABC transporter permease [Curvibacter sp. CHRR-16]MBT0571344.1 metal ABC transporter permease [Curvibacter sp. CHRR-16]
MSVLNDLYTNLLQPFGEFAFMRRALVASVALSVSAAPLGVLLSLRRMSLMGDALSHAVLPGVAIGFMVGGLSITAMALGGMLAGMLVVALAGLISRATTLKEDTSLAALYLLALALGVMLIASSGSQRDVLHILFGRALGVDDNGLLLVAGVATVTMLSLAMLYRGLVLETLDPLFLSTQDHGRLSTIGWQQAFLMLVVLNLVAGFQTLGTLMAVGLMVVPAVSARLWWPTLTGQMVLAALQAGLASVAGLLISYQWDTPTGPTIIGCTGVLYALALLLAPDGWLRRYLQPWQAPRHRVG